MIATLLGLRHRYTITTPLLYETSILNTPLNAKKADPLTHKMASAPQARILQKYKKLAEDRKRKEREQETEEEQQAFSKRRSNVPITASGRAKSRLAEDLEKIKRSRETKADATEKETKKPKHYLYGATREILSGWTGRMFLGQGGQGKATLFIKQDKDGKTIDQMVIKEVGEDVAGKFDSDDVWHDKDHRWILAREVYIHHLLTANATPLSSIVKCFGGDVREKRRTYRVFTVRKNRTGLASLFPFCGLLLTKNAQEYMDGGDLAQYLEAKIATNT